jgi:hypothetical protein
MRDLIVLFPKEHNKKISEGGKKAWAEKISALNLNKP